MTSLKAMIRPNLEAAIQPTFLDSQGAGKKRDRRERDDAAAIKTYRYLRLGMIVIVVGIIASILIQHHNSGCWQGSISAYYYTPTRPVFVGGLLAIGISLIMIKGSTPVEDALLNLAGCLAPVVAFIPTNFEQACNLPTQTSSGYPFDDVRNNIGAYLIAGVVALLIAAIVFAKEQVGEDKVATRHVTSRVALLLFGALLVAIGAWALATDRIFDWHGWSAVAMFGVLAIGSLFNAYWLLRINRGLGDDASPHWQAYAILYAAVGTCMIAGGAIIKFAIRGSWDHRVLVLELVEISLFGLMWLVQSGERWGKILQTPTTTSPGVDDGDVNAVQAEPAGDSGPALADATSTAPGMA
jgi:cytochrome bd-type quinol oxidase subunit 2